MKNALVDSNLIIYTQNGKYLSLRHRLSEVKVSVNPIVRIEVLGWKSLEEVDRKLFERFFANSIMLPLNQAVYDKAIELRSSYRIGLPDALIAATAICNDLEVWTANLADFKLIKELKVLNPLA